MEIGKIKIDFSVFHDFDSKYLIIGDSSKWRSAENKAATIEIIPPGSVNAIVETFQKYKVNVFNSTNLGLNCVDSCGEQEELDLPDGIWKITVKSAYTDIEKIRYYLKTDVTRATLDEVYIKNGLEYDMHDKNFRQDLSDIEFLLSTAAAFARKGNFVKADRDFREAHNILNKYVECKNCI